MLTESSIDISLIKAKVEENYNLKIEDITFIQGGECSWGYRLQTDEGMNFFLKIHTNLQQFDLRFELTHKLYSECGIKNITHPFRTKSNEFVFYIDKFPIALFNFIDGDVIADKELDTSQKHEIGKLLAKIHNASEIIGPFEIKEDFIFHNKNNLIKNIDEATHELNSNSEYKNVIASSLIDNKDKILQKLNVLENLGNKLRAETLPFVICHGEPHNWNIIENKNQELFLIDWDDCLFAPKEKDLTVVKDDADILEGYRLAGGDITINEDVIKFYDMKWNLSEIEDWSSRILYEEENDTQNDHYREEFLREMEYTSK